MLLVMPSRIIIRSLSSMRNALYPVHPPSTQMSLLRVALRMAWGVRSGMRPLTRSQLSPRFFLAGALAEVQPERLRRVLAKAAEAAAAAVDGAGPGAWLGFHGPVPLAAVLPPPRGGASSVDSAAVSDAAAAAAASGVLAQSVHGEGRCSCGLITFTLDGLSAPLTALVIPGVVGCRPLIVRCLSILVLVAGGACSLLSLFTRATLSLLIFPPTPFLRPASLVCRLSSRRSWS